MREDVVPFVTLSLFLVVVVCVIAGYAIHRKFNVKKTDYEYYDGKQKSEEHEMKADATNGKAFSFEEEEEVVQPKPRPQQPPPQQQQQPVPQAAAANNPFKNKAASSNPFQNA